MINFKDNNIFWNNAINIRRSCRSYEIRKVEPALMEKLKSFISQVNVPFTNNIEVRFLKVDSSSPITALIRNPPPDFMAFVASTDLISLAKTGFMGELAILYATGLGLSTCWYGHYTLSELEKFVPDIENNQEDKKPKYGFIKGRTEEKRVVCISPLGYWQQRGIRMFDRITKEFLATRGNH